jgi:hypothetical protein
VTVTIEGTVIDIFASSSAGPVPMGEGLCVSIADPGPVVTGTGDLSILGTGLTDATGSFSVADVTVIDEAGAPVSSLGLVTVVSDCPGGDDPVDDGDTAMDTGDTGEEEPPAPTASTMYPSGTGISSDDYLAAADGDTLSVNTFGISNTYMTLIDTGLVLAGHSTTFDGFSAAGGIYGWLNDTDNNPIAGGSVTCSGDCPAFYQVDTPGGAGLFANVEPSGIETATETGSAGVFVMPGAPVTTYTAAAEGYTFEPATLGSLPGLALIVALYGEGEGGGDTGDIDDTGADDTPE